MECNARFHIAKSKKTTGWYLTVRIPQIVLDSFSPDAGFQVAGDVLGPFWGYNSSDSRFRRILLKTRKEAVSERERVRAELRVAEKYAQRMFHASFDLSCLA